MNLRCFMECKNSENLSKSQKLGADYTNKIPLAKGGRGMFHKKGKTFTCDRGSSKTNGTSPCPLHKGEKEMFNHVRYYQIEARFSGAMYIGSVSVMPNASYQALMCGKAPFTRQRPSECGSLLVYTRICSSRILPAQTPE